VTRKALESSYRGGCKSMIIGLTDTGQEIGTRPFQRWPAVTGMGMAFGGARSRTDVPNIVDWYWTENKIDPMITRLLRLDEINSGFELVHAGKRIRNVVVY